MNQIPNVEETHSTRGWEDEFVEQGANLEHERWAKWQAYLHSKLYEIDDHRVSYNNHLKILPTELYERWERQIATPYKDLSEAEKESDRKEARTYLPLIHQQLQKAREQRKGWKGYVAVDPKADNYKYSPVFSDRKGAELWVKGKEISGLEVVEVDILLVDHSELDQDKK